MATSLPVDPLTLHVVGGCDIEIMGIDVLMSPFETCVVPEGKNGLALLKKAYKGIS